MPSIYTHTVMVLGIMVLELVATANHTLVVVMEEVVTKSLEEVSI